MYYGDQNLVTFMQSTINDIYIRDKVDPDFLQNLALVKLSGSCIPNLSQVSNTLKAATGLEAIGIGGLVEPLKFF